MEFLEANQIVQWAEERGLARGDGFEVRLPDLPSLYRREYANGRRSGQERAATDDFIGHLGTWDECVVWIRSWGVWPSGEDWPQFYAWRGAFGERRSVETAPGHRFNRGDGARLAELVTLIMENAWDADVLCSRGGRADGTRGRISHDEWYEILGEGDPKSYWPDIC
jgi:hypothetical protein